MIVNRNDPRQRPQHVRLVLPFIISSGVLCFGDEFFIFFWPLIIFSGMLCFGDEFYFNFFWPLIIFSGICFGDEFNFFVLFFLPLIIFSGALCFGDKFFRTNRAGGKSKNGNNFLLSCYSRLISSLNLISSCTKSNLFFTW